MDRSKRLTIRWGVGEQIGTLLGALLACAVPIVPLAYYLCGPDGAGASGLALLICGAAGISGLVVSQQFRRPELVLYQVFLHVLFRMGLPLAACVMVYLRGGGLVEAGFAYYVLGFYLVTLAVETMVAVISLRDHPASTSTKVS